MVQTIVVDGTVARMQFANGLVGLIDASDVPQVSSHRWHTVHVGGGRYYIRGDKRYLHRFLTDAPRGMDVDHINGDRLDNRRTNLRIVSHRHNMENRKGANSNSTTGVRGVYVHRVTGRKGERRTYYNVRVMVDGKSKTQNFPCTPEGLERAKVAVVEMREQLMEYA